MALPTEWNATAVRLVSEPSRLPNGGFVELSAGSSWPDPAIGNCIPIAAVDRKSMQMVSVRSGRGSASDES